MFQARHNGQNYVFALLTGYRDPPAGVSVNCCLLTFLIIMLIAVTFAHSTKVVLYVNC